MTADDLTALRLTLQLAAVSLVVLLALGTPLAWWLAQSRRRWTPIVEAIVALPLVLPPTVLGFYLLLALAPDGPIGSITGLFGSPGLAFTFSGLVIGSVLYSLPFVVQPLQSAFSRIPPQLLDSAACLGLSPLQRFWRVVLPQSRRGVLTACVLGFAHTLGEFGVVLMIGGNLPGETRVASIAIYEHVEALDYTAAHQLSGLLLGLSFAILLALYLMDRKRRQTAA